MQTSHVYDQEGKRLGLDGPAAKAFFDERSYGMFNEYKVLENRKREASSRNRRTI